MAASPLPRLRRRNAGRTTDAQEHPVAGAVPLGSTDSRIRSLDGIRAVALVIVVATHLFQRHLTGTSLTVEVAHRLGFACMTVFFVISGFLITRMLSKEQGRTGRVNLPQYYLRRAVRLWPALWTFVAVVLLLGALGLVEVSGSGALIALGFVTNYLSGSQDVVFTHTWSLALEEQFYLLWPLALLAVPRRHMPRVLVVAIAVAPVVRLVSYALLPSLRDGMIYQFHVRYDALAIGCLLGLIWDSPRLQRAAQRFRRAGWIALSGMAGITVLEAAVGTKFMLVAGYSLENFCAAVLVVLAMVHSRGRIGRFLNHRVVVTVGLASYSIYLWQQLFTLTPPPGLDWWPVSLLATVLAGATSYLLLEKPFMAMRSRLRQPNTGLVPHPRSG